MTNSPSISKNYTVNPDVIHRKLGEETVVINLSTDKIYNLNLTGSRFWELFVSGITIKEVEATLLDEFNISEIDLEKEISELLNSLLQEGLIRELD